MTGYGSNKFVVGFGEQSLSDKITLSGTSGANIVTTGATLTVNRYSGMRMYVLLGTNANKVYHVVSNTAGALTLQEANTGFANNDTVIFEQKFRRCDQLTNLQSGGDSYDRNTFVNQTEDLDFFTPTPTVEELYSLSSGQDRATLVSKTISYNMPVSTVIQDFRLPYALIGYELCISTTYPGTPFSSTIKAANNPKPGECQLAITATTNLTAGDYICIGWDSDYPEVRRAMNVADPIRLDRPLKFPHSAGESVKEVIAPFTHYLITSERTQTGTNPGGTPGGGTLNGATVIGATSMTISSPTNYAVGDYIQIGTTTNPEIRKITEIAGSVFTLDMPLRFNHANGVTCAEVTTPFNTTVTEYGELPGLNFSGTYTEATNFVRDALWCKFASGEFNSDMGELLRFNGDLIGCKIDTTGAKAAVTVPSTLAYQFRHMSGGIYLNNVQYANIESFKYRIERGTTPLYTQSDLQGASPYTLVEQRRRHELGMTVVPMNTNFYNLLDGQTMFNVYCTYSRGANDTASFYLMDCYLTAAPHGMVIDGPVRVSTTINPAYLLFIKVVDDIPCFPQGVRGVV